MSLSLHTIQWEGSCSLNELGENQNGTRTESKNLTSVSSCPERTPSAALGAAPPPEQMFTMEEDLAIFSPRLFERLNTPGGARRSPRLAGGGRGQGKGAAAAGGRGRGVVNSTRGRIGSNAAGYLLDSSIFTRPTTP